MGPLAAGKGTLGIRPSLQWGGLETGRGRLGKVARLALGREQRTTCLSEERLARRWGAAVRGHTEDVLRAPSSQGPSNPLGGNRGIVRFLFRGT